MSFVKRLCEKQLKHVVVNSSIPGLPYSIHSQIFCSSCAWTRHPQRRNKQSICSKPFLYTNTQLFHGHVLLHQKQPQIPVQSSTICRDFSNSVVNLNKTNPSSDDQPDDPNKQVTNGSSPDPKPPGLFKRFREAYKEYGKVMVAVHVATSIVWYGSFYYAVVNGVDIVPILKSLGAGESIIRPLTQSGLGDLAMAYLLYKLFTPARYTVTLAGTRYTVVKLRKYGYMAKPDPQDSIRNLMKEGQTQVKDRLDNFRDRVEDVRDEMKDNVKDRLDKMKKQRHRNKPK